MKKLEDMNFEEKLDYYCELPYTIQLIKNADGTFFGSIKELRGCMTEGDTGKETLEMLEDAKSAWLEIAIEDGDEIPLPESLRTRDYSGRFNIRIPRSLHRQLIEEAKAEGVSLNAHTNFLLGTGNNLMQVIREKNGLLTHLATENYTHKQEIKELKQERTLFQSGHFEVPEIKYKDILAHTMDLSYKCRKKD